MKENLLELTTMFLTTHPDQLTVLAFREKYKSLLCNDYIDIILTMREFPEFNILDYINFNIDFTSTMELVSEKKKHEQKIMLITRNNLILTLLIVGTEKHFEEKDECNTPLHKGHLFDDLSFLKPLVEKFKSVIIENDNIYEIEYDVEVLFLALMGYKDKARVIKQKHNNYFKKLIADCNLSTVFSFDIFLNNTLEKNTFSSLNEYEIIVYRHILNNAARRKLYHGFDFLVRNVEYCYLIAEGRIWKNLGKRMTKEEVFSLWLNYEDSLNAVRVMKFQNTIATEYKQKIELLQQEIRMLKIMKKRDKEITEEEKQEQNLVKLKYRRDKLIDETKLYFVTCLKELFVILFKYDLKEVVLYFFEMFRNEQPNLRVPISVYEICLDYDEDISVDIMELALNSFNVKKEYMQLALIKKNFRLARALLQFRVCREYLNENSSDNYDYLGWLAKFQVKHKKKQLNKFLYQHSNNEQNIIEFMTNVSLEAGKNKGSGGCGGNNNSMNNSNNNSYIKLKDFKNQYKASSMIHSLIKSGINEETNNLKNIRSTSGKLFLWNTGSNYSNYDGEDNATPVGFKFTNSNYTNTNSDLMSKGKSQKSGNGTFGERTPPQRVVSALTQKSGFSFGIENFFRNVKTKLSKKNAGSTLSSNNMSLKIINNKDKNNKSNLFEKKVTQQSVPIDSSANQKTHSNRQHQSNKSKFYSGIERRRRSLAVQHSSLDNYTPSSNKRTVLSEISHYYDDEESSLGTAGKTHKNPLLSESPQNKEHAPGYTFTKKETIDDIKLDSIKKGKFSINVHSILIDQLRQGEYVVDALSLLSVINPSNIHSSYYEKIISYLLTYTEKEDSITRCSEPLLFIAMAAEFLTNLGKANKKFLYKTQTALSELISLGEKIQSSIKDDDVLSYYLKEQYDHKGRNVLEIYAENKFYQLLNDISVGSIVDQLWYGSSGKLSILKYLRVTRILTVNIKYDEYKSVMSRNFYDNSYHFFFEYSEFIRYCSGRYFFDSMMLISITVAYQLELNNYSNKLKTLETQESFGYLNSSFFIVMYLIHYGFTLIFLRKTHRKMKYDSLEVWTTIILLICILLCFTDFPSVIYPLNSHSSVVRKEDYNFVKGCIESVTLLTLWLKVLRIFMASYSFGPLIRTIINIFWEVFVFLVVLVCITFLSAQIFTLFFSGSNPEFEVFYTGFIALFNTVFGQLNFANFTSVDVMGCIMLMLYTTLSNIILYNLIVAIINNLFKMNKSNADAESRAILILAHERMRWDDKYGSLILLPPPFNMFSLITNCILLCSEVHTKKFNRYFTKVFYVFIAFALFLFLFILGFISLPFAYFKSIAHSVHDEMNLNIDDTEKTKRYLMLFGKILIRPFELFYYLFEDMVYYWSLTFHEDKHNKNGEKRLLLSKEYINSFRKVITFLRYKQKKRVLSSYEMQMIFGINNNKKKSKKRSFLVQLDTPNNNTINTNNNNNNTNICSNNYISPETCGQSSDSSKRSKNNSLVNSVSLGRNEILKQEIKGMLKDNFRDILDKLVDIDGCVDLERALALLPYRVKYSDYYLRSIAYYNVRILIRGVRKYLFVNKTNNSDYSIQKLFIMIYKLVIKLHLVYGYFNDEETKKLKELFEVINALPQFEKNNEMFLMYEKKDDESEYDDEGEMFIERKDSREETCKGFSEQLSANSVNDTKPTS